MEEMEQKPTFRENLAERLSGKWTTFPSWWTPGRLIWLMIVFGLSIIFCTLRWYTLECNGGDLQGGWCGTVGKNFPWTLLTALSTGPAVILTWYWREKHKREDLETAREGQVTERFIRAMEQVGNESSISARMGGIYALGRIMEESPKKYHWTVVSTLIAFIRHTCPVRAKDVDKGGGEEDLWKPGEDVQAALTVIGERNPKNDSEGKTTNLIWTRIGNAWLPETKFPGGDFQHADMTGVRLFESKLQGAKFNFANLSVAHLERSSLVRASFLGANLRVADFSGADLTEADLSYANMGGIHLEGATLKGAHLTNSKMQGAHMNGAQLQQAVLQLAKLQGANLNEANLDGTNLFGADLVEAKLHRTSLKQTTLSGANLERAEMQEAMLCYACFVGANLADSDLSGADLSGANLQECTGLTVEQVRSAIINDHTKLPPDIAKAMAAEKSSETPQKEATT